MSKNVVEPERLQTICHLRVAYWISKQPHARILTRTRTHKYAILIAFHGNSISVNAPEHYVTRTLSLLLTLKTQWQLCVLSVFLRVCDSGWSVTLCVSGPYQLSEVCIIYSLFQELTSTETSYDPYFRQTLYKWRSVFYVLPDVTWYFALSDVFMLFDWLS